MGPDRVPADRGGRGSVLVVFILLTAGFSVWALATPLFGAPDEPSHTIRAASLVRGQLLGPRAPGRPDAYTAVQAPQVFVDLGARTGCWAFEEDVTPTCAAPFSGPSRLTPATTYVGSYPPFYYALVGLASQPFPSATGIYLMRLVSAAAAAGLLTLAVTAALPAGTAWLRILGLGVAVTPTVAFLAGSVNPNGMEVVAAIALWVTGLILLDPKTRPPGWKPVVWVSVAAGVLALSRGLSPLWVAAILAVQALAVLRRGDGPVLRDRRIVVVGISTAVVSAVACAWLLATGLSIAPGLGPNPVLPWTRVALVVLGATESYVKDMVGVLQWADAPSPFLTHAVWFLVLGFLGLVGLAVGDLRARLALVSCVALTILAPLLQVPGMKEHGFVWQGRYALPLAVGVPILAVHTIARSSDGVGRQVIRRLLPLLTSALVVGMLGSFVWAGRRNAVGLSGPLLYFGREEWRPPLPSWALFAAMTLILATAAAWLVALARRDDDAAPAGVA